MSRMPDIPVIASLPFLVSAQCRDRLAEGVSCGRFEFPQSAHPDVAILGILTDRPAILAAHPDLYDPLAALIPLREETPEHLASRCQAEMTAARGMPRHYLDPTRHAPNLHAALVWARRACGLNDVARRRSLARTDVPRSQSSTLYPEPRHIPTLLATADRILHGMEQTDAALSATFAYCSAVHCHAFRDGNKQAARILWSAMAARREADALPLALLSNLDRRAFTIHFRRVILFGTWEPLLLYLLAAAEACHAWIEAKALPESVV